MMFDPWYWIMIAPALIFSLIATVMVKSRFAKYSRIRCKSGYTGAQVSQAILHAYGLTNVSVESVGGHLSDHYDPRSRTVRLSPEVYSSDSVAALGVAAHETGHAIQHAQKFVPLVLRNAVVPLAGFGSHAAYIIFFIGLIMSFQPLIQFGIALFSVVVVFTIATLPVEINASTRAVALLTQAGVVTEEETSDVKKVLTAAALTYVAAALMAIMQLVYMILRSRR